MLFSAMHRARGLASLVRPACSSLAESGAERQVADAEREAARARRFGAAAHHSQHHHHAGASAGAGGRARRRDFLGYYKMLGIESADDGGPEAVGTDDVKAAYKRTAMALHPDRHVGADEPTRRRLSDRFNRAQQAYETLKDPERRRQYDRGQLVSGG
jgi:DnaJ-class molecular chaperone